MVPPSPYGMTKYMTEVVIRDVCKAYSDWGAMLLRYFNPAGAHLAADIGEEPQGTPNNLMPYVSQVAVGARPKLFIFGGDYDTPDGTPIRYKDTFGFINLFPIKCPIQRLLPRRGPCEGTCPLYEGDVRAKLQQGLGV